MKVAQVQFVSWDKVYYFSLNDLKLNKGDRVLVRTEMGPEIGTIIDFAEIDEKEFIKERQKRMIEEDVVSETDNEEIIKPILRKATDADFVNIPSEEKKQADLSVCREYKQRLGVEMKFVDAHYSYDGSRITFAFIADGRVDFRNLVKDLSRHFNAKIRLQQIGIRDEVKICGDCGHCGKPLCCRGALNELVSITSDMSDVQQCAHRGSDRLSGICGRLMCCLAYENEGYRELAAKMPPLGAKVNVDGKRGEIISHNTLKQSVRVKFYADKDEGEHISEVSLNRKKKDV